MSGPMSTTTPGMQQAAVHFASTHSMASSGVKGVADALAALKSTWSGEASLAFDGSMKAWMADCSFIMKRLESMIDLMHGNRKVIIEGESANTDLAKNIPVGPGLPGL